MSYYNDTYEKARQPTRLRKSTTVSPIQKVMEDEPAVRASAGSSESAAYVSGHTRKTNLNRRKAVVWTRTIGSTSFKRMEIMPISDTAVALCDA
jgi:hypothetical protein